MVHEIKGDTVAPGMEGLLNLHPDDFVFYVGGYPSNFTVGLAQSWSVRAVLPTLTWGKVLRVHSPAV